MAEKDDDESGWLGDIFAAQLREFDRRIAEVRDFWDTLNPEERKKMYEWLEKVAALGSSCQLPLTLSVQIHDERFDENGNQIYGSYETFSTFTLLEAIKCWEKGEPFTPDSVLP
jgi:hypothetical protein